MISLEGQITLLFEHKGVNIEIFDKLSGLIILQVHVDAKETVKMLSRLSNVPCAIKLNNSTDIGKVEEVSSIDVQLPKNLQDDRYLRLKDDYIDRVQSFVQKKCEDGWIVSDLLRSQGSFYWKNEHELWVHATIRRWI